MNINSLENSRYKILKSVYMKSLFFPDNDYPIQYDKNLFDRLGITINQSNNFLYIPKYIDETTSNFNEIHTCGLSFGGLCIAQYKDILKIGQQEKVKEAEQKILAVVRSIILLCSNDSWGSSAVINMDGTFIYQKGDINETTLCLSTLYKLGFFDQSSEIFSKNISPEHIKNRYILAIQSIRWILKKKIATNNIWGYSAGNEQKSSLTPTQYVVNVLNKFLSLFLSHAAVICSYDNTIIEDIILTLKNTIVQVKDMQRETDIYKGCFTIDNPCNEPSIFNTCSGIGILLNSRDHHTKIYKDSIVNATKYIINTYKGSVENHSLEYYHSIQDKLEVRYETVLDFNVITKLIHSLDFLEGTTRKKDFIILGFQIKRLINKAIRNMNQQINEFNEYAAIIGLNTYENNMKYPIYYSYYYAFAVKSLMDSKYYKQVLSGTRLLLVNSSIILLSLIIVMLGWLERNLVVIVTHTLLVLLSATLPIYKDYLKEQ